MFKCTVCEKVLEPHSCKFSADGRHCELYVICPYCGGECREYNPEEEEEYEESKDREIDD